MTLARWPNKIGITSSGYSLYETATISNTFGSVIDSGTSSSYNPESPSKPAKPGIFKYRDEYNSVVSRWVENGSLSDGAWITMFGRFDWRSDDFPVLGITLLNAVSGGATASIKVGSAWSSYGIQNYSLCNGGITYEPANTTPRRWYIKNIIDELDSPGEYYIDRTNKKLYFYPPSPITVLDSIQLTHRANKGPSTIRRQHPLQENYERGFNAKTGAPTVGTVGNTFGHFPYPGWTGSYIKNIGYISVGSHQGRYANNLRSVISSMFKFFKCKNLTIEGITFKNCTGTGIELQLSDNILIKNCHIYNMDRNAVRSMGGRNVVVQNCTVHDIGHDGIVNVGGNRRTLIPGNNYIIGCDIRRWARHAPDRGYGAVINGCGNVAAYNVFTDSGGGAISQIESCLNVIEYNNFTNILTDTDDDAAIYHGNSRSAFGNIIRNNFFNKVGSLLGGGRGYIDMPYPTYSDPIFTGCKDPDRSLTLTASCAIYFDNLESFHTIENNVFYDCTKTGKHGCIFFNGGIGHNVNNNIFIDCYGAISQNRETRNSWNTNFSTVESAATTLNVFDDPWYDEDPGYNELGGITYNTGYTVWNNPFSNLGSQFYFIGGRQKSWFGLFNNVDIRNNAWIAAEPRFLQLVGISKTGTDARMEVDLTYANLATNDFYNNVMIGCSGASQRGSTLAGQPDILNPQIGGFSGTNLILTTGITFTDKNNLNFKLTQSDVNVITKTLPKFKNIEFEKIPSVKTSQSAKPNLYLFWSQPPGVTSYVNLINATNAKNISISVNDFGCLITNEGKVVCFGNNDLGQCSVPFNLSGVKQVSCGYNHTVALLNNGSIVGWGATGSGTGLYGTQTINQQILSAGLTAIKIDAGAEHALALLSNGDVVAWGKNETAQLSDPDTYWTWPGRPGFPATWNGGYYTQSNDVFKYYSDRSGVYNAGQRLYRCSGLLEKRQSGCESPHAFSGLTTHWLWNNDGTTGSPSSLLNVGLTLGWEYKTGAPYDYQFSRATTNDPTSINYGGGGWIRAVGETLATGTSTKKYKDISAGRSHNLILATDGKIELWGTNYYYNVTGSGGHTADKRQDCPNGNCFKRSGSGSGKYDAILEKIIPYGDNTSETVKSLKTTTDSVYKIATSYYGNIIIKPDGTVFAWDRNECGECTGLTLSGGVTFAFVNGAYRHNLGIGTDGNLAISGCWYNGSQIVRPYLPSIGSSKYVWAGGSRDWSIAQLDNGSIIAWGNSLSKIRGLTIYQ
jgi:hypothetical protein